MCFLFVLYFINIHLRGIAAYGVWLRKPFPCWEGRCEAWGDKEAASLSIGRETGPRIGVQKGPLLSVFSACPGSEQVTTERRAREVACLPARASWGDQPRFLNRQDSLPVSMISQ